MVRPTDLEAVQRHLKLGEALVGYASLGQELWIWLVQPGSVTASRVPISPAELERGVAELERGILDRQNGGLVAASTRLYQLLLAPVVAQLRGGERLWFVPDLALQLLPFAVLRDPVSGRYLVEKHQVAVIPSAAFLVAARSSPRARSAGLPQRPSRVLVIGNPEFDRGTYPLPYLRAAEKEARNVAAVYGRSRLLVGSKATKEEFLADAPRFDIVHFAGHAIVRPEAPSLSHLLFGGPSHEGALYSRELAELDLSRVRLVVLSGCHTAAGRLSSTEGPSSLARAFFAAGVPAVIASLWAVDDEGTARFFEQYHRKLSAGENPLSALSRTQQEWIRSAELRDAVGTWGAFQFFGVVPTEYEGTGFASSSEA